MDLFSVLNLEPGASLEEAKRNYRKLCLQYHPDKNPNTSDKFKEITATFKSVLENPALLNPAGLSPTINSFIQIKLLVPIRSIYLNEDISFYVDRLILCKNCNGTGFFNGRSDVCEHCSGKGSIQSSVLRLLGQSDICPVCKGSGSKSNKKCRSCKGTNKVIERKTYVLKIGTSDVEKGRLFLKGMGNEHVQGVFGDIQVIIKVVPDTLFDFRDGNFITYVSVSPVDRILRSRRVLDVYGLKFSYDVIQEHNYYIIEDKRPGIPPRTFMIKYLENYPFVTPETRSLYEKIRQIELSMPKDTGDFKPL
jgi:DnaJ-class molecular chaperone